MDAIRKERLDLILVERKIVKSREQAQRLILAGNVLVEKKQFSKPGDRLPTDISLQIKEKEKYVGRGGLKFESAYKKFLPKFQQTLIADVGASTGGFTDFALKHGAKKVYAVDVGKGQLDLRLRNNPKVTVMEGCDIRKVASFPEKIDYFLIDLSFVSLKKILPHIFKLIKKEGSASYVICLVKPQFEVGKEIADKFKGVIKDIEIQNNIVDDIISFAKNIGFKFLGSVKSKIKGQKGNQEYFIELLVK